MDKEKRIIILTEPAEFIRKDGTVEEVKEVHVPNHELASLECLTCGVCGKVLTFFEEKRIFKCGLCGTEEENNCRCPEEHYICKGCSCVKMGCVQISSVQQAK